MGMTFGNCTGLRKKGWPLGYSQEMSYISKWILL